ncbi:MAG: transketolase N-terminal domain protein [Parcubacteria group bacterium LiPW_41]|nr:MAG: transketolase N-terminal domain protein [Parcubacteria group bacterium LiPW_41]
MERLTEKKLAHLYTNANRIRELIIESLLHAGSGHSAGPLGMADIFSALYFHILTHNPKDALWDERDRVVLSNGHICPVQYATLALAGYFPIKELLTLRKIDSRLQGHPHRNSIPGIETTSGPLGSGLSQSIGMALALSLDKKRNRVYCMMSDGEHQEGNTWEAVMFAGKKKLSNLTAIIDRNNIQIDGFTEDTMPLEPFRKKYEAFGWNVIDVDGHNIEEFIYSVLEAQAVYEKPTAILAHTIPGKGVTFMERNYLWHGKSPNKEEAERAIKEIRSLGNKISHE